MKKILTMFIAGLVIIVFSGLCLAKDDVPDLTLTLDDGVGYMVPPEIIYAVDLSNSGKNIETDEDISYNGGLKLGLRNFEISYRYDLFDDEEDGMTRNSNTGQAAGYGGTGVWANGIWDYEHKIVNHTVGIGVWSEKQGSLTPYFGFSYQNYKQEYDLNSMFAAGYRRVYDTECNADFYGLKMGGVYATKENNGWKFNMAPMLYVHYVRADAQIIQDPDSTIGGFDTVTQNKDNEKFSFGCSIDFGVQKYFTPSFMLGLTIGGVYIYNQPTLQLPNTRYGTGDIDWENAYMAVSRLELKLLF
jgi:hypothetical protein